MTKFWNCDVPPRGGTSLRDVTYLSPDPALALGPGRLNWPQGQQS